MSQNDRGRGGRGRGRGRFRGAGHGQEFINRDGQREAFSRPPHPPFAGFQPRPPVPGSEIGLPTVTIGSLPSQQPRGWGPSRLSSPQIHVIEHTEPVVPPVVGATLVVDKSDFEQVETVGRQARRRKGKSGAKPSAEHVRSSDRLAGCPSVDSESVISVSETPVLEHTEPVVPPVVGATLVVDKSDFEQVETVGRQARRRKGKSGAKPSAEHVGSRDRLAGCPSVDSESVISVSEKPRLDSDLTFPCLSKEPNGSPEEKKVISKTVARQRKTDRPQITCSDFSISLKPADLSGTVHIPSRPDKGGTLGVPVRLLVNCFDVQFEPKRVIVYCVEPISVHRVDSAGVKRDLRMPPREKRALLRHIIPTLPKQTLYDGGHIIFAEQAISGVTTNGCNRTLDIPDPLESGSLILTYRILETQTISTGDILDYLNNPNATTISMPQDAIRVLDCFLKTFFKEFSLESLGKMALFEKDPTQKFQQKLFGVHKGYLGNMRPQWKVRINLDLTFKAFLIAGNLADVLYDKYGDEISNRVQQMLDDVKGIRVQTNKLYKEKTSHVRRFTVHGISREPTSKLIISELKQSVKDYFETKYGLKLKYDLPCVKVKPSREEYMPMELLDIMPFQSPNPRKYDVASDIIRVAAKPPQLRFKEIQDFLRLVLSKKQSFLQASSVKIHDQPVTVVGRVLKTPVANFGGADCLLTRGKWIVKSFHTQAFKGKPIVGAVFSVPPHRNGAWARGVVLQQLPNVARGYGISFELRDLGDLYPAAMLAQLKALPGRGFSIAILVLLDDFNYGEIKRLGDIRFGIRTQCVRDRTLKKPNVMQNLLLKINGKLGGTNWILPELTLSHPGDRFMVFGADVTHPSPTQAQELRKSVAAVTGSVSLDLMRYAAVVRQQATTRSADRVIREIIDQMESMMKELLECYIRKYDFPTKLIFYRDGVSEGQFQTVLMEELRAIQNACTKLRPDYQPAITYIVVQKRHHIRFMPEKLDPRNRTGNADPGTVVDREVTHHREFDFYLCSAEGIQGTSKPAKYHVLYDDSNWSSDALQAFTFYLCHAYMRCSRSVSYPAPTYYSHLAAFRARDWLNGIQNLQGILEDERFCVHSSQVEGMFFL